MSKLKTIRNNFAVGGDGSLWILFIIMSIFSVFVVYSSTVSMAYREAGGDTTHYVVKHAVFMGIGFFITYFVHLFNPWVYFRVAGWMFAVGLVFSFMVFVPGIGVTINGAARWVEIPGISLRFMPSDFLKVAMMLYLARNLGRIQDTVRKLPLVSFYSSGATAEYRSEVLMKRTLPLLVPMLLSVVLVFWGNLSTALIFVFLWILMMYFGRVPMRWVWNVVGVFFVGVCLLVLVMYAAGVGRATTWVNRIAGHFNIENSDGSLGGDGFQSAAAEVTVASGGFMGKGPGKSTQRAQLPHPYSDYAYAFILEEYGLLGGIFVLSMYMCLMLRSRSIVVGCRTVSQALLVTGMLLVLLLSALVNILVSVGLMPVTGQSLPLISMGGTSVLANSLVMGIILGISRHTNRLRRIEVVRARQRAESVEFERLERERRAAAQARIYGEEFLRLDPIQARLHARGVNRRYGFDSSVVWDGDGDYFERMSGGVGGE